MYDAQGVRRQTGELTLKVNSMNELIEKIQKEESVEFKQKLTKKLKRNVRPSTRRSGWRGIIWCIDWCHWSSYVQKRIENYRNLR